MHFAETITPNDGYLGFEFDSSMFEQILEISQKDLIKMCKSCSKEGINTLTEIYDGESSALEIQLVLRVLHSNFETGLCPGTQ